MILKIKNLPKDFVKTLSIYSCHLQTQATQIAQIIPVTHF
jgi:hypothetical protein